MKTMFGEREGQTATQQIPHRVPDTPNIPKRRRLMPGNYDPLRYGPSTNRESTKVPPRCPPAKPPECAVLARNEDDKNVFFAFSCSSNETYSPWSRAGGAGGSRKSPRPILVPTEVLSYDNVVADDVRLSLPDDIMMALSGDDRTTDRGRTRRGSLSWHCRERLGSASSTSGGGVSSAVTRHSCESWGFSTTDSTGAGRGGGRGGEQDADGGRTGRTRGKPARKGRCGAEVAGRGERIDAEQLFRRKKKLAYRVTYNDWAESYDRSVAQRAQLKRKERLETERQADIRRQRAEEESQKWLSNHTPSAPATAMSAGGDGGGVGGGGGRGGELKWQDKGEGGRKKGQRKERAEYTPYSWRENSAKTADCAKGVKRSSGDDDADNSNSRGRVALERDRDEGKRREIDRAFRRWLADKKKRAQSEREARRQKEELQEERRRLEVSRRWKKRPVVCAYTYGAKVGARQWGREIEQEEC